jgi:hypothetical protein
VEGLSDLDGSGVLSASCDSAAEGRRSRGHCEIVRYSSFGAANYSWEMWL